MTKRSKIIVGATLGLLIGVPGVAFAVDQEAGPPRTRAAIQAQVQERFSAIDTNRDGAITKAEMDAHKAKRMQERDARRTERRAQMFTQLDTDRNGQLSQAEFSARPDRGADRGPEARDGRRGDHGPRHGGRGGHRRGGPDGGPGGRGGDMFARIDANNDGRVTLAEMSAPALARFDRIDTNRDGTISDAEKQAARAAMRGPGRTAPQPPAPPAPPAN